jgi:tetratricopeptide (TPR) repeat protein
MRHLLAILAASFLSIPASAKWIEASSAHFVVYANDTPRDVERFSAQLERFHAAVGMLLGLNKVVPSPSNRVTIFVVKDDRKVRELAGNARSSLYAFYVPRAGASIAIVPQIEVSSSELEFSMIALLHEYAHHITLSTNSFPMPRWLGEGVAEFYASAKFEADGGISIGRPAMHRAGELFYARDVTVTMLLDPDQYEKTRGKSKGSYDAYYGKSWLLYHYLFFNAPRTGQLSKYLKLIGQGKSSKDAGIEAFGDLAVLEKDLDKYLQASKMTMLKLPGNRIETSPVTLRELCEGEAAIMPVRIRSRRGVTDVQAKELVAEARTIAARYPKDAAVLAALAEAEYDADDEEAAIAAADAAIARDPKQVNAYVQKGFALFRKAAAADDKKAAYRAALVPFTDLNKIENDHPLPLIYYYLSYTQRGVPPTATAVSALGRASELAPFDLGLRGMKAFQEIRDKKIDDAIFDLAPLAYNPHGGKQADRMRALMDQLKAGKIPDQFGVGNYDFDEGAEEP